MNLVPSVSVSVCPFVNNFSHDWLIAFFLIFCMKLRDQVLKNDGATEILSTCTQTLSDTHSIYILYRIRAKN